MSIHLIKSNKLFSQVYKKTIYPRAKIKIDRLHAYVKKANTILDIGAGNAGVAHCLHYSGKKVTCVDVADNSFYEDCPIVVFDGRLIPFKDDSFDQALILTVLHHVPKDGQIPLIQEAARCSKELIIMEDVYTNKVQKVATHIMDSIVNLQLITHPFSNRTEEEWEYIFHSLNLDITKKRIDHTLQFFRQVTWVLKSNA